MVPRCGVWPESGPPPERSPPPPAPGRGGETGDAAGPAGACASGASGGGVFGACRTSAGRDKVAAPAALDPGACAARGGLGATEAGVGTAARSGVAMIESAGTEAPDPGREAVDDEALIGNVSGGWERVPGDGSTLGAGAAFDSWGPGSLRTNCRIRSTMARSRLARALTLTSRPHFWIRSSRSWLLKPNSFANSWTRVDKGKSSWIGPQP
jgi:hypothetical protein